MASPESEEPNASHRTSLVQQGREGTRQEAREHKSSVHLQGRKLTLWELKVSHRGVGPGEVVWGKRLTRALPALNLCHLELSIVL